MPEDLESDIEVIADGLPILMDRAALGPLPPPFRLPVSDISDRQFAQGLAHAGLISEAEAEDWVGPGIVPEPLMGLVDELPQGERFAARMLLRGAKTFKRSHPLTAAFAAMHGWSDDETDQFWRDCAAL